ncbi:MAG: recombinase family protein [Clostridia bacterium]|nr:recombinase family protein [Clostridia bacterium]
MNAVIYARFSSHRQTEQSIEGQLKVCYEYAERNGYTIVGEYIDRAISGTSDARPDFLQMIKDSANKSFQFVIVYQLDRFARNRYDSATYKAKLKKNGVRVLSAKENISHDASGILMEAVLEGMAEYYSAELGQKIKRGMDINAEKCLSTGGCIPLGFAVGPDKRFIIEENGAAAVRLIFEMFVAGHPTSEICRTLNDKQIRTTHGAKFNKNSLRTILRNRRYLGIYTYKGNEVPGGMPRIISDELFEAAQRKIEEHKAAPAHVRTREVEYLLTTRLFCGKCGHRMIGERGRSSNGASYSYYKCVQAKVKACNKKAIRQDYIEDVVVSACRALLTDENIKIIAAQVSQFKKDVMDTSELDRLEKLLAENKRNQEKLTQRIIECDIASVRQKLYEDYSVLQESEGLLVSQIAQEKEQLIIVDEEDVIDYFTYLRDAKDDDIRSRRALVTTLVNKIYLYDDEIDIDLTYGGRRTESISGGNVREGWGSGLKCRIANMTDYSSSLVRYSSPKTDLLFSRSVFSAR